MKDIIIKLDFRHGPLWKDKLDIATGAWSTGIKVIDEDAAVQALNAAAETLYTSLFFCDNKACDFDNERFEESRPSLLALIQTLILRLTVINDGTYRIVDEETSRLISNTKSVKTA